MEKIIKICIVCNIEIPYLEDFPGCKCLKCYEKEELKKPIQKPNFIKTISL